MMQEDGIENLSHSHTDVCGVRAADPLSFRKETPHSYEATIIAAY